MPEAPSFTYRPMTEADLAPTSLVRRAAIQWLDRSEGHEPTMSIPIRPVMQAHILRTDPGGCWLAEMNGLVLGYAQSLVRGDIWSLSQLFVQPEVHAHGAGQGLLEHSVAYAEAEGARVRYVIASSSPAAHALYLRHGMLAAGLGYRLSGPVEALRALPEPVARQKRVVDCSGWLDKIAALDVDVWGAERRQEHVLFIDAEHRFPEEGTSLALTDDGELLGYCYALDDGWFGMLAAREPELQLPLLRMAGDWFAERGIERAHCYCISHNATVMRTLAGAGWRIDGWNYFQASAPFGQFDRYVPSGGLLL